MTRKHKNLSRIMKRTKAEGKPKKQIVPESEGLTLNELMGMEEFMAYIKAAIAAGLKTVKYPNCDILFEIKYGDDQKLRYRYVLEPSYPWNIYKNMPIEERLYGVQQEAIRKSYRFNVQLNSSDICSPLKDCDLCPIHSFMTVMGSFLPMIYERGACEDHYRIPFYDSRMIYFENQCSEKKLKHRHEMALKHFRSTFARKSRVYHNFILGYNELDDFP